MRLGLAADAPKSFAQFKKAISGMIQKSDRGGLETASRRLGRWGAFFSGRAGVLRQHALSRLCGPCGPLSPMQGNHIRPAGLGGGYLALVLNPVADLLHLRLQPIQTRKIKIVA